MCTRSRRPRGERLADRHRQASRHTCLCPRASMAGRGRTLRGPFTRSCALLSLHVRPGASVLYVRTTRTSLLRAVRTRSAGQLAPRRPVLYVRRTRPASAVPYVPRTVALQAPAWAWSGYGRAVAPSSRRMRRPRRGGMAMWRARRCTSSTSRSEGGGAARSCLEVRRPDQAAASVARCSRRRGREV